MAPLTVSAAAVAPPRPDAPPVTIAAVEVSSICPLLRPQLVWIAPSTVNVQANEFVAVRVLYHRDAVTAITASRHIGVDLGPLERRLPDRLFTPCKKINLAPREYLDDLDRLRGRQQAWQPSELVLIGRRQLRSNNSWLHNSERLVKGKPRCTLLIHPDDTERVGVIDREWAVLSSRVGEVEVPVEVSDAMLPGVVSLPHGWGHGRDGVRLGVASAHPGASINDVTDEQCVDELTGTAALSGQRVRVRAVRPVSV
ncbi:MAG: hypothetical protein GEV04_11315 [Actinophytocola sp.]|nr:hypothetical protein [Actinophytocola sp.]